MNEDQLLTPPEVAALLRCSTAHVYKLLNGSVPDVPQIPHVKLGRKKMISLARFEKWKVAAGIGILPDDQNSNAVDAEKRISA